MSTPNYYYLLEVGDRVQNGDEFYGGGIWQRTVQQGLKIDETHGPYRRLAPAQSWPDPISTDRYYPTESECQDGMILGFDDGQWKFMSPEGFKLSELKFWMRLPPKPVEVVPDGEQAWRHHSKQWANYMPSREDAFKAGYEAGRKAKL